MLLFPFRPRAAIAVALCAAALAVAPRAQAAPADSTGTPPLPIFLGIEPVVPCTLDSVRVVALNPCRPCFDIVAFQRDAGGRLRLEFTEMSPAACSTLPCEGQVRHVDLGRLAPGLHTVLVDVVWHAPDSSAAPRTFTKTLTFEVSRCGQDELPFRTFPHFGTPACDSCPPVICPGEPVPMRVDGVFPSACWRVVSFAPLPTMDPLLRPVVRLTVRHLCGDSALCPQVETPFSAATLLGATGPGLQSVELQVTVPDCPDTSSVQFYRKLVGYRVPDSCAGPPPAGACVWPFLDVLRDTRDSSACVVRLRPGGRGEFTFATRAEGVPLAGLQGDLQVSPGLRIENLQPAGVAAGMRLDWRRQGNGAAFVLYSGHGAPIPVDRWANVLRVTVASTDTASGSYRGHVYSNVTAGSDSNGTAIPPCPIMTLVMPAAVVCVAEPASCDANGDAVSNVADLVRMVTCLVRPEACPDSLAARPDCNQDGAFHLDDVFCCAHAILGGPPPGPGVPPGDLAFSFGAPVRQGNLLRVPLHVRGAGDMGGALLRIEFPSDRWLPVDLNTVGGDALRAGAANDWTPLLELGTDDVLVGLLRLDASAPTDLTVELGFALRDGAEAGGELRVAGADVSAGDGTPITVDLSALTASLGTAGGGVPERVALSPARPNPASGATSFVVSLPRAAQVDLAMFDLAGRRVATLHRGALAAGERAFTWRPGAVPSGVYFARLAVDGVVRSSRVTLKVAN